MNTSLARLSYTTSIALLITASVLGASAGTAWARVAHQSSALVQVANNAKYGNILVNAQGMTLYELTSEANGNIKCTGGCLAIWPPLLMPAGVTTPTGGTGVTGTLGVVTRSDGSQQVTYNGYPLYTFASDKAPGDANGQGIKALGGVWQVITVSSVPLSATPIERLEVRITSTGGTVWGKVTLRYYYHHKRITDACAKRTCNFNIPLDAVVHLAQKPASASTWPFQDWKIKRLQRRARARVVARKAVVIRMNRPYQVIAAYVLHY